MYMYMQISYPSTNWILGDFSYVFLIYLDYSELIGDNFFAFCDGYFDILTRILSDDTVCLP